MSWRSAGVVLLGMGLLAVIAPLSQLLTFMTVNAEIETATPVGWAVGILFSLALGIGIVHVLARKKILSPASLALLYMMVTIGAPLMNLGLVRQFYLSVTAVLREYVWQGTSTYRTAFNSLSSDWVPKVPRCEGMAWLEADRLLRQLDDPVARSEASQARRQATQALDAELRRRALDETHITTRETLEWKDQWLEALGVDELGVILSEEYRPVLADAGLLDAVYGRLERAQNEAAAAADHLIQVLRPHRDLDAFLLPSVMQKLTPSGRQRLERVVADLDEQEAQALRERVKQLAAQEARIRGWMGKLSSAERARLHRSLAEAGLERLRGLDEASFNRERGHFVFRLDQNERRALLRLNGAHGAPNENLIAFWDSLWATVSEEQARASLSPYEQFLEIVDGIPWQVWAKPVMLWGLLFTLIFLLLMCVAEWLRRKWVDRENLAFPLVEVADYLIRPDRRLELAEDIREPQPRQSPVSLVFLGGVALGFLWLLIEAVGHYTQGEGFVTARDLTPELRGLELFRDLAGVVFVLSPIVIGLLFLVNLEISFSIWAAFLIFKVVETIGRAGGAGSWSDGVYTGWAGGRFFPFPMEQFLGAAFCFAGILLFKAWRDRKVSRSYARSNPYIPDPLNMAGLVLLPVAIVVLFWWMGITNLIFLGLVAILVSAQTLALARTRAETGLPTQPMSYDFGKLPIVFGLSGLTGSKVYCVFVTVAFLPMTLLFRTLPQQLENLELARRLKMKYSEVAVASLSAFLVAITVGLFSFLILAYGFGNQATGVEVFDGQDPSSYGVAVYPLWASHFLGEEGIDKRTSPSMLRVWFICLGFGIFAVLTFLRSRFLSFPLHPIGYMVMLATIYYSWVSPYHQQGSFGEHSLVWGSALTAWLIKKLVIKYGGMNTYKSAKPFFIGLVVGAVLCVFAVNLVDLIVSLRGMADSSLESPFLTHPPFSPRFY